MTRALAEPGELVPFECRAMHRDGSWRHLEGVARNLIHDPAIEGIVVNVRDVTHRKGAEETIARLRNLERFLAPPVAERLLQSGDTSFLESHRQLIAVIFGDIRGFTAFAEPAEPEEVMDVLGAFNEAMGAEVRRFEGTLGAFMGDGFMVFFNDPIPCEDPAWRAVQMVVAMRDAVEYLAGRWRGHGHDLGFGAGIGLGYATLGMVGLGDRADYTAIGSVVNRAARLCGEAKAGQILLGPQVHAAVTDLVEAEFVGELTLKGIPRPLPTFQVLGLRK